MGSEVQHLRLSGHSQNPLSSSFPIIIILGQYSRALGVDLDPETHDIHHLLAVTPAFNSSDDVLAPLAVRGMSSSAFCA